MQRTVAILAFASLLVAYTQASGLGGAPSGPTQGTTYSMLAPYRGQWSINMEAKRATDELFVALPTCNETANTAPCLQPLLNNDNGAVLRASFTLKQEPLTTVSNLAPTGLIFRACYSATATKDRPWRKPNNVIDKDKSCPFVMGTSAFNASTYEINWKIPGNATLASFYPAVYVQCQNDTQTSFCQVDSTVNATYFGTDVINQTPLPMIIATAVCSALGPLALAAFFTHDALARRKQ